MKYLKVINYFNLEYLSKNLTLKSLFLEKYEYLRTLIEFTSLKYFIRGVVLFNESEIYMKILNPFIKYLIFYFN